MASEGVQQRPVRAGVDQGAVVVLAVDLDQRARPMSRISATLDGWSLTKTRVRPSADCARRRMMSPSSSMALSARMARAGWLAGNVEDGRHLPLLRAVAHQRGIAPPAERKRQGVEQDRLAGAGLAGEHGEPVGEIDVQPFDENDVADREA